MSDPIRLKIQKKLQTLLSTIDGGGNPALDLRNKVFRNRKFGSSENDEYPFVSINQYPPNREFTESIASFQSSSSSEMVLYIEGLVGNTALMPGDDDAEILLALMKQALAQNRGSKTPNGTQDALGLGSKITKFDIATGTTAVPNEVNAGYLMVFLPIRIQFVEDMSNPFT